MKTSLSGFSRSLLVLTLVGWPVLAVADEIDAIELDGLEVVQLDLRKPPKATATAKKSEEKAADAQRSEREVGPGDELSFRQLQVAEEMRELEQRMFRLAETLKALEPENSSRLMLGLKYAREELIAHRMDELREELAKLALTGAVDEQRQVLVKLERLQQLLLSNDLDFEMKLERLRQIRATLRKLNAVVKEESRQEKRSKSAAGREKELAELAKRRAALEALIKKQEEHVEKNAALVAAGEGGEQKQTAQALAQAQNATRKETSALSGPIGKPSPHLKAAGDGMQAASTALAKPAPAEATSPMDQAVRELKEELADLVGKEAQAKAALAKEQLATMRKDQEENHRASDEVAEMTRGLGNNGTAALAEIVRAGGFMGKAESSFGGGQPGNANADQGRALEALKYAEELLAEEAERLARQLRREVKKRVNDGLTLMLEEQTAVRERTSAVQAGVKQGSRQALAGMAALAKREERITDVAQELINVVEETEFGIALPAAIAAVRDATDSVQMSLAEGDASDDVVAAEIQIETDLKAMLAVVNEMSDANSRTGRRGGNSIQDQRKEQNRIISELKMLRLLQSRVHQSTKDAEAKRTTPALTAALRKRIEEIEGRQEDVRDATERLAEQRGDEIPEAQ